MTDESTAQQVFSSCAAFAGLEAAALAAIRDRCTTQSFRAGDVMIRQGERGDALFMLVAGSASAFVTTSTGKRQLVGQFIVSELVGEMALLTREPRTADVVATADGRALVLKSADFHDLVVEYPEIIIVLTHLIADRLGKASADGLGDKVVDRFRIVRCIGIGGMAVVYEAVETDTGKTIALKMMSHRFVFEPGAKARFHLEADMLADLEHANITRVFHKFSAYRTLFIAMEYCDGTDLSRITQRGWRPTEKELRRLVGQIAAGLDCVHSRGVAHRDLKPSNLLIHRNGLVQIADFGLARSVALPHEDGLSVAGMILGTPFYMAPEQMAGGAASPACDVYALGLVILNTLTGLPPVAGRTFTEIAENKKSLLIPPRRELGLSRKMYTILCRCLATDPKDRSVNLRAIAKWGGPLDCDPALFEPIAADSNSNTVCD